MESGSPCSCLESKYDVLAGGKQLNSIPTTLKSSVIPAIKKSIMVIKGKIINFVRSAIRI